MKMAKRFKLKLSRVFTSFKSYRSKDPSNLPLNHVPSFFRLSSVKRNPITRHLPPQPTSSKLPHYSFLKRHVSSRFRSSAAASGQDRLQIYGDDETLTAKSTIALKKMTVYFHLHRLSTRRRKNDDTERRNNVKNPDKHLVGQQGNSGLFSSESLEDDDINDEETETLVSSLRSFSTDSSSEMFNANLQVILETKPTRQKKKKSKKVKKAKRYASESDSPARLSSFLQRMIPCTVEGKVRESFAVVKKSEDPYENFKGSMVDMILEKQMFKEKDLEQLLHCFLSLNSRHHHGVIIQAFSEILGGFVFSKIYCFSSFLYF
ncbi:Transcription repressor OFP6 [Hibiscus syriacus]|uniref:Transcription repressor n=1 Tax=Hibiscus syriacus TaxID=106335 RepID=A0A6A2XHZ3_HIBSY|nr:Transcription repressor OFP6 [Hibiscus syriacus]